MKEFENEQGRFIEFSNRDFVGPSFWTCPSCGKEEFGILSIFELHYTRLCRACGHKERFALPRLKKMVVYLDQFAVSDMMKALNPATKAHQKARVDDSWRLLFRQLDRLGKMLLIVCPESKLHWDESLLSASPRELRMMYRHLAGEVKFRQAEEIEYDQLSQSAENWASGNHGRPFDLSQERALSGNLHGWIDRLRVDVDGRLPPEILAFQRRAKRTGHAELLKVFEVWRREKRSFEERFQEELQVHVRAICRSPVAAVILEGFRAAGVHKDEVAVKVRDFVASEAIRHVPFLMIHALLFAALSRKVISGKKRVSPGIFNDARMVAHFLPYCDAMLVDNEIAGYLREEPLRNKIRYGAKVFSKLTLTEFLAYLGDIEKAVDPEQIKLVRDVYGPDWEKPFESMYTLGDPKRR